MAEAMARSRKRSRDEFTAEEMEAADALLRLSYSDFFFAQWAVTRKRSSTARDDIIHTRITRNHLTKLGLWAAGLPPFSKVSGFLCFTGFCNWVIGCFCF